VQLCESMENNYFRLRRKRIDSYLLRLGRMLKETRRLRLLAKKTPPFLSTKGEVFFPETGGTKGTCRLVGWMGEGEQCPRNLTRLKQRAST